LAVLRSRILLSVDIAPLQTSNEKSRRSYFRRALEILVSPLGKV
jgi:hypothetical protein